MTRSSRLLALSLLPVTLVGLASKARSQEHGVGAVYVATNAAGGNAVLGFARSADGRLDPTPTSHATGGEGTGTGLGNQGGLVLSRDGGLLLVVNAGSDEISVFRRASDGDLELRDVVTSGGTRPISVTLHGHLLYVLNAGGMSGAIDQITGFSVEQDGELVPVPGSTRALSAATVDPAQIGFAPDGRTLVVSEKGTNILTTFSVDASGVAGMPMPQPSAGMTPFGFAFGKRGQLLVSEAFGGAMDASALSAYVLGGDGTLDVIEPSAPTTETAACWVAVSRGGRFAYTTNTGSGSISGFAVAPDGTLELLDSDGATASTGGAPIDLDFFDDGRFLYALDSGTDSLSVFGLSHATGALTFLQEVGGLPDGSNGLGAR
jgi:6-phosphogluconolactonase